MSVLSFNIERETPSNIKICAAHIVYSETNQRKCNAKTLSNIHNFKININSDVDNFPYCMLLIHEYIFVILVF